MVVPSQHLRSENGGARPRAAKHVSGLARARGEIHRAATAPEGLAHDCQAVAEALLGATCPFNHRA